MKYHDLNLVLVCGDCMSLPSTQEKKSDFGGILFKECQSLQVPKFFSHIKLSKCAYFWRFSHINVTSDSDSIKVIIMAEIHCHCFNLILHIPSFHGCTSLQQLVKNFNVRSMSMFC